MNVKILGTGCPNCLRLEQNIKQALAELKLDATIEKVTEIQEIMNYGIMSTPALVIDEIVLFSGMVLGSEDIKEKIKKHIK
jgi:small redox-active disulfide protein 2